MAIDEQDLELIDKYIHGKLQPVDVKAFEERLKADKDFAEEVGDYKDAIEGIDQYGRDRFSATVAGWEQEMNTLTKKKETKIVPFKKYLAMAATLALLLISGYFLFFYQSNENRLFAQHFQPYENITNQRSGDPNQEQFQEGMAAYDVETYEIAIERLQEHLQANPNDHAAMFYLGEALLANDQTDQAINYYIRITEEGNSLFREVAEWHLALAYLKQKNKEKGQAQLRSIIDTPDHTYYQQALKLKEDDYF